MRRQRVLDFVGQCILELWDHPIVIYERCRLSSPVLVAFPQIGAQRMLLGDMCSAINFVCTPTASTMFAIRSMENPHASYQSDSAHLFASFPSAS